MADPVLIEVFVEASPAMIEVPSDASPTVIEVQVPGPQGPEGPAGTPYTGPQITVSTTPPTSPVVGDIWIDLN